MVCGSQAATLNVVVAGYFGGNVMSTGTALPDGTVVDFGIFYSGGSFTSAATIATALSGAAYSSFRADNGWVSFGTANISTPVGGVSGDFTLLWDANTPGTGPGFGAEFELNPAVNAVTLVPNAPYASALNGENLVGKTPFLWVQTPGANAEYGLFVSNQAFTNAGFGAITQVDVADVGDAAFGVSALLGVVNADGTGITTATAIPEPSTLSFLVGVSVLSFLRRRDSVSKLQS
jgi:uncharacterized protein YaiE (UPF0345 family)